MTWPRGENFAVFSRPVAKATQIVILVCLHDYNADGSTPFAFFDKNFLRRQLGAFSQKKNRTGVLTVRVYVDA
jgi:hypothetical protein